MKKIVFMTFCALTLLISNTAQAHIKVVNTEPSNNAALDSSPGTVEIQYSKSVRLVRVALFNSDSKALELDYKPDYSPESDFNIQLPELSDGEYRFEWTAMGSDAHKMVESLTFTVKSK
ncbi:copper resistance CopC family protein [Kangiella shandongensis]|uniref:copper resistance CopC family protein n=1 Tax=Kangiella shandongensis TaxID=2763258 RepID=UPI001CBFDEF5|nr:copper resistance protein CopC [Kangiella shandongensis]